MKEHQLTPESTRSMEVDCRKIRLVDGADWGFARPTIRLIPKVVTILDRMGRSFRTVNVSLGFGYTAEIQEKIDDVMTSCVDVPEGNQASAFFSLASLLLRCSHHLSEANARVLLSVSEHDVPRLVQEIMAVVTDPGPACEAIVSKELSLES